MANVPASSSNDSVRLLIPKTLQITYDLRNKRNIGHTGGNVDSNFADATLASTCCSWVLAEFLRMYHTGNIDDAQELVDSLVQIKIPLVQEIQGNLKLLNDNLSVLQKILVLLSHRKTKGMTFEELVESIGKKHSANIRTTLCNLDESGLIYKDKKKNSAYFITLAGEKYVAEKIGFEI